MDSTGTTKLDRPAVSSGVRYPTYLHMYRYMYVTYEGRWRCKINVNTINFFSLGAKQWRSVPILTYETGLRIRIRIRTFFAKSGSRIYGYMAMKTEKL